MLADWQRLIVEARRLGCRKLDISGGEPTLYSELPELVKIGDSAGMIVNINTNASLLGESLVAKLVDAGLSSITVSLYGAGAGTHDMMRGQPGLFQSASDGIRSAVSCGRLIVNLQTILARENLAELDQILALAYDLGAHNWYISYIEGDIDRKSLPSISQIQQFRADTLGAMLRIAATRSPEALRQTTMGVLSSIFAGTPERLVQLSLGQYFPTRMPPCSRPSRFALILANGDVHPCNGVEYSHEPVLGNVFVQSLAEVWTCEKRLEFVRRRHAWCHACPMEMHVSVPLSVTSFDWPGEWASS